MTYTTEHILPKAALIGNSAPWKKSALIIFRILFIYFILQAVPLDWKYYKHVFSIDWTSLHYRDLFYIARYTSQIFPGSQQGWGLNTLADWGAILLVSIIG